MKSDFVMLRCGNSSASISLLGAELRAWNVDDADMLWTPDPAFWDATAPVLFPVCGWTRGGEARVDGNTYPLGLHGFGRFERFEMNEQSENRVRLVLRDNAATRAQYPFAFTLSIEYRLEDARLSVEISVTNEGATAMPYAVGLHPGFQWPLAGGDKDDYAIRFDHPEKREVPVIAPGGLFSDLTRPAAFSDSRTLPLAEEVFAREALCFLDAASSALDLIGPRGRALRIETSGFPHIVLWSRPGAPFLCIETWSGYGDPEHFSGELAEKPSMILLAPAEERLHSVTYTAGAS